MSPRAKAIIEDVAQRHQVTVQSMLSDSRAHGPSRARFEAMYLIRSLTKSNGSAVYSLPQIGRFFDRDHTSVMSAISRWQELTGAPPLHGGQSAASLSKKRHLQKAAIAAAKAAFHLHAAQEAA